MARWSEVVAEVPELATSVQACFDAYTHKTIATVRKDGAPRISGTELSFEDGDVWFGSMWQARKALDLQRDSRMAVHSATVDMEATGGDAKMTGRVEEITDPARKDASGEADKAPPGPWHLFRVDVTEIVLTRVGEPADHLVIESWHEGEGLRRVKRT